MALSLVMAAALSLPLAGCKDTDVLTEKIVGAVGEYEVDYSLAPARAENPSAASDTSREQGESDRLDDYAEDQPEHSNDQTTTNDEASQLAQSDVSNNTADATEGSALSGEAGEFDAGEDGSGKGQTITFDDNGSSEIQNPNGDGSGMQTPTNPSDGWNPNANQGEDVSRKGSTFGKGDYSKLPEAKTIAAAGQLATIVQAIGGAGSLVACNQQWLDDLPATAFDNQRELAGVRGLPSWGDGTAAMSDATCDELVGLKPDVVLTSTTYGGVTSEQATKLNDAGINVVEVPPIGVVDALDADIVTAVEVVGELLRNAGDAIGLNAKSQVSSWKSQHTQALEKTMQNNGGYTTWLLNGQAKNWLYQGSDVTGINSKAVANVSSNRYYASYIDAWADSKVESVEATSIASNYLSRRFGGTVGVWPVRDWVSMTEGFSLDVSDGVGVYLGQSGASSSAYALMDYYLQHAGVVDMLTSQQNTSSGEVYVGESEFGACFSISKHLNGRTHLVASLNALWGTQQSAPVSQMFSVGDDNYPAIIVRTKAIAAQVKASADKVDKDSKTVGLYNYGTPYQIWVMPSGIAGSWADGTFESFLMAPWAYCTYQQRSASGQVDLSYSNSFVNGFYQTFYRCSADGILNGDGNKGDGSSDDTPYGGYEYGLVADCPRQ